MHPKARYLFIASMDVKPEKEALFNEVYDTEHIPLLLRVPGVLSAVRHPGIRARVRVRPAGELVELRHLHFCLCRQPPPCGLRASTSTGRKGAEIQPDLPS